MVEYVYKATIGADNPFRYRGYYYDDETGLYYLNQRYYNPEWGRFINADDFMGVTGGLLSHNVFAYCANNPVMYSDPSGCRPSNRFGKANHSSKKIVKEIVDVVEDVLPYVIGIITYESDYGGVDKFEWGIWNKYIYVSRDNITPFIRGLEGMSSATEKVAIGATAVGGVGGAIAVAVPGPGCRWRGDSCRRSYWLCSSVDVYIQY